MKRSVALILLWLLAAAGIAGVVAVQRIERPGSPIGRPIVSKGLSPNRDGHGDTATMTLNLSKTDSLTVDVVDDSGNQVVNVLSEQKRQGKVNIVWDGETESGKRAPEGIYHFRAKLEDLGRTINLPQDIRLDITPPTIRNVRVDMSLLKKRRIVRVRLQAKDAEGAYFELDHEGTITTIPAIRMLRLGNAGAFTQLLVSLRVAEHGQDGTLHLVIFDEARNPASHKVVELAMIPVDPREQAG